MKLFTKSLMGVAAIFALVGCDQTHIDEGNILMGGSAYNVDYTSYYAAQNNAAKPAPKEIASAPLAPSVGVAKPSGTFVVNTSSSANYRAAYGTCIQKAGISGNVTIRQKPFDKRITLGLVQTSNISNTQYKRAADCMSAYYTANQPKVVKKVSSSTPL